MSIVDNYESVAKIFFVLIHNNDKVKSNGRLF